MLPKSKNEVEEWVRDNELSNELFLELEKQSITTLEQLTLIENKYNLIELMKDKLNLGENAKFEIALSNLKHKHIKICNCKTRFLIFFSSIILFILFLFLLFDYVFSEIFKNENM